MSHQNAKKQQDGAISITGNVGSGSVVGSGQVNANNIAGGDIIISNDIGLTEVQQLFKDIFAQVEQRHPDPKVEKEEIIEAVKLVQEEVEKGEQVNETILVRRLRNLARMAPDIWEVTLATLSNPVKGIATVVTKVVNKLRAEADTN